MCELLFILQRISVMIMMWGFMSSDVGLTYWGQTVSISVTSIILSNKVYDISFVRLLLRSLKFGIISTWSFSFFFLLLIFNFFVVCSCFVVVVVVVVVLVWFACSFKWNKEVLRLT